MAYVDIQVGYTSTTSSVVERKLKDGLTGVHGKVALAPHQRVLDEPRLGLLKSSTQEMAQHRDTIDRIAKAFTMHD